MTGGWIIVPTGLVEGHAGLPNKVGVSTYSDISHSMDKCELSLYQGEHPKQLSVCDL